MSTFIGLEGNFGSPNNPHLPTVLLLAAAPNILLAQGAAVANYASFVLPDDGQKHLMLVAMSVNITVLGTGSINAEVTYTDDNGTARAGSIIPMVASAGTYAALANTADAWSGFRPISCQPASTITLLTAGTFTGGIQYNLSGAIWYVR